MTKVQVIHPLAEVLALAGHVRHDATDLAQGVGLRVYRVQGLGFKF